MPKRTRPYHDFLLEQLADPIFASDYLNEARQESRAALLKALRNVAEARRMAVVAAEAGVNRESLYKSLSEDGNPRLETYDSVLKALGIDYEFKPTISRISIPSPIGLKSLHTEAANELAALDIEPSNKASGPDGMLPAFMLQQVQERQEAGTM